MRYFSGIILLVLFIMPFGFAKDTAFKKCKLDKPIPFHELDPFQTPISLEVAKWDKLPKACPRCSEGTPVRLDIFNLKRNKRPLYLLGVRLVDNKGQQLLGFKENIGNGEISGSYIEKDNSLFYETEVLNWTTKRKKKSRAAITRAVLEIRNNSLVGIGIMVPIIEEDVSKLWHESYCVVSAKLSKK